MAGSLWASDDVLDCSAVDEVERRTACAFGATELRAAGNGCDTHNNRSGIVVDVLNSGLTSRKGFLSIELSLVSMLMFIDVSDPGTISSGQSLLWSKRGPSAPKRRKAQAHDFAQLSHYS